MTHHEAYDHTLVILASALFGAHIVPLFTTLRRDLVLADGDTCGCDPAGAS